MIFISLKIYSAIDNIIAITFHSYDARGAAIGKGSHWADDVTLNSRGYFKAKPNPSILSIDSTKSLDSGVYRCRVDFHKSPTRNSKVNLTIISKLTFYVFSLWYNYFLIKKLFKKILLWHFFSALVPPENVLILDEKGSHIPHYILGPYNEGGSVDLTCMSTGGELFFKYI